MVTLPNMMALSLVTSPNAWCSATSTDRCCWVGRYFGQFTQYCGTQYGHLTKGKARYQPTRYGHFTNHNGTYCGRFTEERSTCTGPCCWVGHQCGNFTQYNVTHHGHSTKVKARYRPGISMVTPPNSMTLIWSLHPGRRL